MGHGRLKDLDGRHLTLLWALESRVGDVDGSEKVLWPGFCFSGFKNDSVPVLMDQDDRRQANPLGQADGLTVPFHGDSCDFHELI